MTKWKASEPLLSYRKKLNSSNNFVHYWPATSRNIRIVSATQVSKRPTYRFFIDHNGLYFPLGCMLDLGTTSLIYLEKWQKPWLYPVLATIQNWRIGSGSGLEPIWTLSTGFYDITKPNGTEPAVFRAVPHFCIKRSLAPCKYLSWDCITI